MNWTYIRSSGNMSLARRVGLISSLACFILVVSACRLTPSAAASSSKTLSSTSKIATSESTDGILLNLSLEQLTNRASIIAVGLVSTLESVREANGGLATLVNMSVTQTLKGQNQPLMKIRIPGGVVDGRQMDVEDAPLFHPGEKVVVFLEETQVDYMVVGGFQGKFTIDSFNRVDGEPVDTFLQRIEKAAGQ